MNADFNAIIITLKLAAVTSIILLLVAIPIAWCLASWQSRFKPLVQAFLALPLILPPTVLGFYLLLLFAPNSPVGEFWFWLTGERLAFSFSALVIGSVLYSLPFAIQPLYAGFSQFDRRYFDVAARLNLPWHVRVFRLFIPMQAPHILIALGLSFAHTIGEFGVVLMIGGNIPGQTRVVSIALFDHVEALDYQHAHQLALVLVVFSIALLAAMYGLQQRRHRHEV